MTPLINKIAARLIDNLEEDAKHGNEIDVRVKFGKFALDTLASCGFGVDAMSFANKVCPECGEHFQAKCNGHAEGLARDHSWWKSHHEVVWNQHL